MTKQERLNEIYEGLRYVIRSFKDDRGDYDNPVFGDGNPDAKVMFIGEAPGKNESEQGKPFVGKAGRQLDTMLCACGISRSELFVTNAVKYRTWIRNYNNGRETTANRTPDINEIKTGVFFLRDELDVIKPELIVTLGNTPLVALGLICDMKFGKIGETHGEPIFSDVLQATIMPLYHPASGIYNKSLIPVMENDLRKLGSIIG